MARWRRRRQRWGGKPDGDGFGLRGAVEREARRVSEEEEEHDGDRGESVVSLGGGVGLRGVVEREAKRVREEEEDHGGERE